MSIKAVLFDLDGTLLPMDQEVFIKAYFKKLAGKLAPLGYEPNQLIDTIWKGTAAMIQNDGDKLNEEIFWVVFGSVYGQKGLKDKNCIDEFYRTDFQKVKDSCGFAPESEGLVHSLKEKGYRVILATNPIFPSIATESRMGWCNLSPKDFEFFTTYENCHYCKPNPKYYEEILEKADLVPAECLMVGNDVDEDMIAGTLGMKVFLLTDCLINKNNKDISCYPHGNFDDLIKFIENI
jgi:HAD superfamily hydrolase (TIGR01549 family)